jgi:hypothetical protein
VIGVLTKVKGGYGEGKTLSQESESGNRKAIIPRPLPQLPSLQTQLPRIKKQKGFCPAILSAPQEPEPALRVGNNRDSPPSEGPEENPETGPPLLPSYAAESPPNPLSPPTCKAYLQASSRGSSPSRVPGQHSPATPRRAALPRTPNLTRVSRPVFRPRSRLPHRSSRAPRRSSSIPRTRHIPRFHSSPPPPLFSAATRPSSRARPGPRASARRGLPDTLRILPTPTTPPHPTPRGSGPSPTTEATPAPHPRSFIVDSKLPKWRRLLPPRKPPPAPTRPLAATPAAPPRPRRDARCPRSSPPPPPPPPRTTSAGARCAGAPDVAAAGLS